MIKLLVLTVFIVALGAALVPQLRVGAAWGLAFVSLLLLGDLLLSSARKLRRKLHRPSSPSP